MRFSVKKRRSTDLALQITSMADCFIIILVFLLKSVATSSINVNPSSGMKLPQADAPGILEEAAKLEINKDAIQVDGVLVNSLKGFRFVAEDLDQNGISKQLEQELLKLKKRQELISKANADVKLDKRILIIADQRTPYVTLKSVLAAASIRGFSDFKLVVAKKE